MNAEPEPVGSRGMGLCTIWAREPQRPYEGRDAATNHLILYPPSYACSDIPQISTRLMTAVHVGLGE